MARWDNMAYVRIVVADTNEAASRAEKAKELRALADPATDYIERLNEVISDLNSYVRAPMHIEFSPDGENWFVIPTQGGVNFHCTTKGELPRATIVVPVTEGIYGGSIEPAVLPEVPDE